MSTRCRRSLHTMIGKTPLTRLRRTAAGTGVCHVGISQRSNKLSTQRDCAASSSVFVWLIDLRDQAIFREFRKLATRPTLRFALDGALKPGRSKLDS